ncbi:MAG: hypothetical protein E4H10_10000 [Bacteroidia bacterium]|nr:MAG: hypothetical protein E4H10_10000 [Bacteroidia bacterium]
MATVIAYGTDKQGYYDLFIESCKRYQIEPVILGWGEKWIGFGKKMMAIRDYIKHLPGDEIVISVDPFDVIFLSNLEEIESKFRQMKSQFLCGALKLQAFNENVYNFEFNTTHKNVPKTPTNYNYLNTGTWISRADSAYRLIDDLVVNNHMTETSMDQQLLTGIYVFDKSIVDIDWKCEIFHNILFKDFITRRPDLTDIKFNETRLHNTATGSTPCVLHASGNTHMKAIALRLGYNEQTLIPVNDHLNYSRKAFFHIRQLLSRALN